MFVANASSVNQVVPGVRPTFVARPALGCFDDAPVFSSDCACGDALGKMWCV
jgi:hypothetical protein